MPDPNYVIANATKTAHRYHKPKRPITKTFAGYRRLRAKCGALLSRAYMISEGQAQDIASEYFYACGRCYHWPGLRRRLLIK